MMRNIVFVPEKVDIEAIVAHNPPSFSYKVDKFNRLMHSLCVVPAFNKKYQDTEYVPLNAEVLKQTVRDYKPYLSYLIKNNVIECDDSYLSSTISKGYRYSSQYSSEITPKFITDFTLKKNISKYWNAKYNKKCSASFLKKWFTGLEFDFTSASKFLLQLHDLERDYFISKVTSKKAINNRIRKATQRYNSRTIIASLLNEFTKLPDDQKKTSNPAHRDHNVKRYHTLLTTLKSELRNFITYQGEPLVNVDISNSQPFFINGILEQEFWWPNKLATQEDKALNINSINTKSFYDVNHVNILKYIMLHVPELSVDTIELRRYQQITSSGQLYYFLYEQMQQTPNMKELSYKKLKKAILAMLYSDNLSHHGHTGIAKKVFSANFPSIYKLLCIIKNRNKACLPVLLQRMESYVIIDCIAARINKEHPEVPIFTVHDSISTTASNVELVKSIMTEELKRTLGVAPTLKEEPWSCLEADKALKELTKKYKL